MANSQHLDWLLEGVAAWNARVQTEREKNPNWRADFSDSQIRAAFEESEKLFNPTIPLQGANLMGANLREANLKDANLGGAYLGGADVRTVNWGVEANNFSTPQFTDLTSVRNLIQSRLDLMTGDSGTILPSNLIQPAHWPEWEALIPTAPPALPDPPPITAVELSGDRLILAAVSGPDRQDLETIYTDLQEDLSALSASGSFNNISAVFDTAFQRFIRICNVAYEDLDQVRFGVQVSAIRLRLTAERGDIEEIALDKVGALDAILLSGDLITARLPEWQTFLDETAPEEAPVEAHAEEVANILTEAAEALNHDPAHFDPTLAARLREYWDTATTKAYLGGITLLTDMAYAVFDNVRLIIRDAPNEGRKLLSQGLAASFIGAVSEKLFTLSSILPNELSWIKPWLVFLGGLMPL